MRLLIKFYLIIMMFPFGEKTKENEFKSKLSFLIIARGVSFIIGYFTLSRLFLNFIAKRIFRSDFTFQWRVFSFI